MVVEYILGIHSKTRTLPVHLCRMCTYTRFHVERSTQPTQTKIFSAPSAASAVPPKRSLYNDSSSDTSIVDTFTSSCTCIVFIPLGVTRQVVDPQSVDIKEREAIR